MLKFEMYMTNLFLNATLRCRKIIFQIGSNESFSDRMNFQPRLSFKIIDLRRWYHNYM